MGSGRSNCIKSRLYLTKSIRLYYYSRYVVCILPTICSTNAYISTLDVVFPQISTFLEDSVVIINGLIYGPLKSISLLQSQSFDRKKKFPMKFCNILYTNSVIDMLIFVEKHYLKYIYTPKTTISV